MLKYSDFEMLSALYETKSITGASEKLFITQPALTKWLHRIEADLGVILVNRNARGITFTLEGQHLVRYGEIALENYRNELKRLHGISVESSQTITLMAAGSLASNYLPKLLSSFKAEKPSVMYSLQYAGSNNTAKGIYEGKADIGFIRGEPWTNCEKALIRREYAAIISKDPIDDLRILPSLPRIDADVSDSARLFVNNWWQGTYTDSPRVSMNVQTISACVNMVKEGLGYSIIISSDVYSGIPGLHVYPLKRKDGSYVIRPDYMIWRPDSQMNSMTLDFLDFAREYFRETQRKMSEEKMADSSFL